MLKCFRYCMFVIALPVFFLGNVYENYNLMLIAVLLVLVNNGVFCFEDLKKRIFFALFNLTFFIFLIARPFISMLQGTVWWKFTPEQNNFAITSIFVALVFLFLGASFADVLLSRHKRDFCVVKDNPDFMNNLRVVSLCIYFLSLVARFIVDVEKLTFMHGKNYLQYYTSFHTHVPMIVRALSNILLPALCVFLSTKPDKRMALIPLGTYFLTGVTMLIVGARGDIVLKAIFVFLYYFIRDNIIEEKSVSVHKSRSIMLYHRIKKWMGGVEKTGIIVLLPIAVVLLSLYNYVRESSTVNNKGVVFFLVDFLYKQGVSFDVLAIAYGVLPMMPNSEIKNYTFGPFVDEIMHGTLAQKLFGATSLGEGNNLTMALHGNSFAHSMSYVAKGQEYLNGHGWGSSYILETFTDFGWIGVVMFSVFIGMILIYIHRWIKGSWFLFASSLMILSSIYFIPRGVTMDPFIFFITPHFWSVIIVCVIMSKLMCKRYLRTS